MYHKLTLLQRIYQRFVEEKIIVKIYIKVLLNRKSYEKVNRRDIKWFYKE